VNASLAFDSGPATTLAVAQDEGEPAATVRYDDERCLSTGDTFEVVTPTGSKLGTATVEANATVELRHALDVVRCYDALYGVPNTHRLISRLNGYYDGSIWKTTQVNVLILRPSILGGGSA